MTEFIEVNTINTDASLNTSTGSNGFYFADASTMNAFSTSGYVFEIGEFDISHSLTIDPSFERIIKQMDVLGDCSAAAIIDVSASQFNGLLAFKTDSADLSNAEATDVSFGVGVNAVTNAVFADISFAESIVPPVTLTHHTPPHNTLSSTMFVTPLSKLLADTTLQISLQTSQSLSIMYQHWMHLSLSPSKMRL